MRFSSLYYNGAYYNSLESQYIGKILLRVPAWNPDINYEKTAREILNG
jgi:hypothetical protein